MIRDERIRYFAPADYSEGSELDELLKAIIDKTAAYEKLEGKHLCGKAETENAEKAQRTLSTLATAESIENQTGRSISDVLHIDSTFTEALNAFKDAYSSHLAKVITSLFEQSEPKTAREEKDCQKDTDAKNADTEPKGE